MAEGTSINDTWLENSSNDEFLVLNNVYTHYIL